jgi:hypothetical protein
VTSWGIKNNIQIPNKIQETQIKSEYPTGSNPRISSFKISSHKIEKERGFLHESE